MTIYDVTIECDDRDAPGLQRVTDAVYQAMISEGCRDGYVQVEVKGPPEFRIGLLDG